MRELSPAELAKEIRLAVEQSKYSHFAQIMCSLDHAEQIASALEERTFEAAFADKLKEFGTVDRLIEDYSAMKMKARSLESDLERYRDFITQAQHGDFCTFRESCTPENCLYLEVAAKRKESGK